MPNAPTRPRRTFDEAFKRDAVAWLLKGEKPLKQLAQDLGVRPWNLRDWLLSSRLGLAAAANGPPCKTSFPQRDLFCTVWQPCVHRRWPGKVCLVCSQSRRNGAVTIQVSGAGMRC